MVDRVMDTEALQTSRAVFLATHHPIRMYQGSNVKGGAPIPYDEQQLLDDFLKPSNYAFAAVLGGSGTGKSHLIRWLEVNIPPTDRRRVLLIPKVGTNLKTIIGRILEGLSGAKFDEYRRRMEEGTQAMSEPEARERLLTNLAIAVGPNQVRERQLTDEELYLTRELPDFLLDGVFRRHLLTDGGRIHELVTHVLGRADRIERMDRPREFAVIDLPLEGIDDLANAGAAARRVHGFLLSDEEMRDSAISWINEHLGTAIRQLLNLSGENMLELMLDVREELGDQGVELVILIEDFAKLQGIDRQLLESLLTRTHQEGRRPLCNLRTALAVTTGYFERLEDTVKTRITFRVEMDVTSAEKGGMITDEDIERFTSRYLNAIRLPNARLEQWATAVQQYPEEPVPSACDGCQFRTVCHASFGERDGVGLYPFNETAVLRAAARVSDAGRFNPRVLINRVMRETFDKYTADIREGHFPSPALQQQFGKSRLPALVVNELRRLDRSNWERRQVLLDLWTTGKSIVNLSQGVHDAFSLPPLTNLSAALPVEEPADTSAPVISHENLPERLAKQLRELDDWQNRETNEPSQLTAQALRELVFRSVVEHIDWDAELLHRGTFAGGAGCLYQQRYITFSARAENTPGANLRPNIPVVAADLNDAALALQGLLLYQHYRHWKFPTGPALRRAYARQLEKWAAAVLDAVRRPTQSGVEWDPVPALVELLAVGARLHGLPSRANPDPSDYVAGLFAEWNKLVADSDRSSAWRDLSLAFYSRRKDLVDQLLARIGCSKGGSARVQIIDATQIARPLRAIRSEWTPAADVPGDALREFSPIVDLRARVAASLRNAVVEEVARVNAWSGQMTDLLTEGAREEIISAIRDLVVRASGAGLGPPARVLSDALTAFPSKQGLKTVRETLARLSAATEFAEQFGDVSRDIGSIMTDLTAVMSAATDYTNAVGSRLESKEREFADAGVGTLESAEQQLSGVIASFVDNLVLLDDRLYAD